ncbi:MAG: NYN domain-containing protein [Chloroflexi bacterium]|nr:MAG: NYN domain-containing protein [Chloroflexota bacterium]
MTTQNTHSEHSDVEESVVKHPVVSENETETETSPSPPALEAGTLAIEVPVDSVPGEQEPQLSATTQNDQQEEHNPNPTQVPQEVQTIADFASVETQEPSTAMETQEPKSEITVTESVNFVESVSPVETAPPSPNASSETGVSSETFPSFPYNIASSLVSEEDVRPFTDFIEEFRQTETRFDSALQSYSTDSLTSTESAAPPINDQAQPTEPTESAAAKPEPTTPAERPVSPLLRPATPRRSQRHGGGRHREETPVAKSEPAQAPVAPSTSEPEPKPEPAVTEPAPAQVEEQPRPARRYRFDRPAPTGTASTSTPSGQLRAEENKDLSGRSSTALPLRPENGYAPDGQNGEREAQPLPQAKQATVVNQPAENTPPKQPEPQAQEAPAVGSSAATTTPVAPDHSRRRHGQERQRAKEQATSPTSPAPTPVVPAAEIAKEVSESVVPNKEEVSPEDLPPLEYAELQKASSRRRRRRHSSGSSNATVTPLPSAAKAATPEAPVAPTTPTPAPSVAVPRTPAPTQSVVPASQYTITSGYTVNQMNQSRDGSNPFMGPDPSPARGTTGAQNVRSIRTDVQRTPAYPVRTTEATSASVHQLANVVSQAIQTQTDRMIAELRRANQSPTNVSVSMPPFPSTERVGVFVDVANLLYSARTIRMTVDFGKLLDFLRGNRRLVRAHAYCPTSPQVGDEQMFLQAVKGLGYRITTKNYKTFSSGAKKADLDLDLCMDVVRLVEGKAVDCVVLVSGDSDFMPMLDYCSDHGVRVEVAAFDEAMSATLRQSCDLFINLSMLEEIRV